MIMVIKTDGPGNYFESFQRHPGPKKISASFFILQGFCGLPFGPENTSKDKNPKVSIQIGFVQDFPCLSKNSASFKLVQSRMIFLIGYCMQRSKEDLMFFA